ncbi:unnamed protein product [Oncorhynchus mykiss]|uniref:Uncharacterized protein n=1 Tax=Oncorhynchus mykiss TaxID=8022 RepID=A0A060VPL6_ONCMY|nr:unnamed protein product [Oncorhynchus mykiss]
MMISPPPPRHLHYLHLFSICLFPPLPLDRKTHPTSSQNTSGGSCHGHKYPAQWSMKYSATNTGADQAGREGEEKEGDEEEEDGKYLQFLEDVTSDILRYGFYSDSVLESVFSWQMTWRHDLSQVSAKTHTHTELDWD